MDGLILSTPNKNDTNRQGRNHDFVGKDGNWEFWGQSGGGRCGGCGGGEEREE